MFQWLFGVPGGSALMASLGDSATCSTGAETDCVGDNHLT